MGTRYGSQVVMSVYVPEDLYKYLKKRSMDFGIKLSTLARQILMAWAEYDKQTQKGAVKDD